MAKLQRQNLDDPAVQRRLPRMDGSFARVGPISVGRARLKPGWRWSIDIKPSVGTSSCEVHHVHVLLAGQFGVRLDTGEEAAFAPGDVFDIPPGHDAWVIGDEVAELLDISGNVGEFGLPAARARSIATLLLTDIVGSTAALARIGDRAWKQTLGDHDRIVRGELERVGGREIDHTGDGFVAELGSAGAALDCALRISAAVRELGIEVRAGVHTGEIERLADDVRGLAVHTAARVMAAAQPSEVLTTLMTRLLVEPGSFEFEARGAHDLKGLPAPLELFAVHRAMKE